MNEVTELFIKAKSFFHSPETWTKLEYYNAEKTRACILGVMMLLTNEDVEIMNESIKIFRKANNIGTGGIANWNDAPGTTFEDLIQAIEKAIDVSRALP